MVKRVGHHHPIERNGRVDLLHRMPILGAHADADHLAALLQFTERSIGFEDVVEPAAAIVGRTGGGQVFIGIVHRDELRLVSFAEQLATFVPTFEDAVVADPLHGVVRQTHPHAGLKERLGRPQRRPLPGEFIADHDLLGRNLEFRECPADLFERHAGAVLACRVDEHRRRDVVKPLRANLELRDVRRDFESIAQRGRAKHDRRHAEAGVAEGAVLVGRESYCCHANTLPK